MKIKKKGVSILLSLAMLVSPIVNLYNFNTVYAADNKSITIPAPIKGQGYKLVWQDEFNGDSLNSDNWSTKSPKMGGRNVLTVEDTSKAIHVEDGALVLKAYKDDDGNYHVPNSVHTKETMNYKYGYVEIRAKLSLEIGSFASFWTRSVSDPGKTLAPGLLDHYTEIDMFETFQYKGEQCVGGNILKNFPGDSSKNWYATPMSWTQKAVIPDEEYHTYGYEWTPDEIKLYFDGNIYARFDITESWTGTSTEGKGLEGWVNNTTRFVDDSGTDMECFNEAQYIIFNHHLHHKDGFTASTSVTENENFTSADYVIDYCRVYQKEDQELWAVNNNLESTVEEENTQEQNNTQEQDNTEQDSGEEQPTVETKKDDKNDVDNQLSGKIQSEDEKQKTDTKNNQNSSDDNVTTEQYSTSSESNIVNIKKNSIVIDKKSGGKFKITKVIKKNGKVVGGNVSYVAPYNRNCSKATIPDNVKISSVKFKVTEISKNAFKNCKKLKSVTIGENLTKIGDNAFRGCSKLKKVTINSKKLTKIGSKAFSGINKNAKVKVPKTKYKKIAKLIRKAKAPKTVKISK